MKPAFVIVQSGGPTAVSNAALAAAADEAAKLLDQNAFVVGARNGIRGLSSGDFIDLLAVRDWDAISSAPGAALGSSRYAVPEAEMQDLPGRLDETGIRWILVIGGNGSMAAAADLASFAAKSGNGLLVAGIPDTIDNDIHGTDFCLGFGSCARYSARTVADVAADVRSLPTPVSIVEVMGRNAGWVAAATMLARAEEHAAPHRIYLPEVPVSRDRFLDDVQRTFDALGWVVVTVAEGVRDEGGESWAVPIDRPAVEGYGGTMVGDVGPALARLVTSELGLRARCEKPGLAARAATHYLSAVDRGCAATGARFAVRELLRENGAFLTAFGQTGDDAPLVQALPFQRMDRDERLLSPKFISSDEQPNDRFAGYARPLVGPLPVHDSLLAKDPGETGHRRA